MPSALPPAYPRFSPGTSTRAAGTRSANHAATPGSGPLSTTIKRQRSPGYVWARRLSHKPSRYSAPSNVVSTTATDGLA